MALHLDPAGGKVVARSRPVTGSRASRPGSRGWPRLGLAARTLLATAALVVAANAHAGPGRSLVITIDPRFKDAPLEFDTLTHRTAAGQAISVTRLDFLLSNVSLRRADGGWLGLTNWFAYISAREGRTRFELNNVPAGAYDRLRFQVGVPAAINHSDPARFDPGHPLNPTVNGLHWNWQGGYVFLALEGQWRREGAPGLEGYSYHLANDRLLTTVELAAAFDLTNDQAVLLPLQVDRLFAAPHRITITADTASTHSREGDELADRMGENLRAAFGAPISDAQAGELPPAHARLGQGPDQPGTKGRSALVVASTATPYRLTFSGFFPRPDLPLDNPLTEEGVYLGRLLFFDPRLSRNNSQSCATCHQSPAAFADANRQFSLGADGQAGTRNAMPLFNLAWRTSFFWDGRTPTLREQVLQPVQNPVEMHETLGNVVAKLRHARVSVRHRNHAARTAPDRQLTRVAAELPGDYPGLFAGAFGSPEITADRVARALEQFLLTIVSGDSKFDRFALGLAELTAEEQRGLELFRTEYDPRRGQLGADCFHCHGGPLFQSQSFANNGLDAAPRDRGRFLATARPGDEGKFAVPSLRNVAVTAPYMHDGRFGTLEEVVEHYAGGVRRSPTLDPNLAKHPPGGVPLSEADQRALVAFLKTLTDARFSPQAASRQFP